jgi:hypothetical protein
MNETQDKTCWFDRYADGLRAVVRAAGETPRMRESQRNLLRQIEGVIANWTMHEFNARMFGGRPRCGNAECGYLGYCRCAGWRRESESQEGEGDED